MVGVAGRSKGCWTCKKRKIKCGLQRPSCQQCVKSARRCGGYEKTHTFVNTAAHEFGRTNRPNGPVTSKKADDTALMELGASSTFLQKRSLINSQHLVQGPSERTDAELGSLSVIDSLPATNQQALAIFINYSVPELPVSDEVPLSWLHSVASMQKLTDVLPLAAAALSYGWLGRVEHQGSMIDHSYRLYAAAIRALRPRLSQMTADVEAELLAAMQALAIFEMLEYGIEASDGWSTHLSGIGSLLQLRGPQLHVAGLSHQIFLCYRIVMALGALHYRKDTFLSHSHWKHVPWSLHRKSMFHQFLDIALDVPKILERVDNISPRDSPVLCQQLATRCLSMLERLENFEYNFRTKALATNAIVTVQTIDSSLSRLVLQYSNHSYPSANPQSISLPFEEIYTARIWLLHYATSLTLFLSFIGNPVLAEHIPRSPSTSRQASNSSLSNPPTTIDSPSGDETSHNKAPINQIDPLSFGTRLADLTLEYVDLAAHDAWRSFGPSIAIFSLKTAVQWYDFLHSRIEERSLVDYLRRDAQRRKSADILEVLRNQFKM